VNLEPWLIVVIIGLVGALIRHAQLDARREQKVNELARRLSKLDGIDANGG